MCKRFLISISFVLMLGFVFANVASGSVFELGIVDNDQDVEERLDRGNVLDMGSSDLELPYEDTGMGDPQVIGLRYPGVTIPKGSTILAASVQFQVDEDKGGTEPVNVIIDGELAGDAAGFANVAFNVTERARTTAQVLWSVPNWATVGDRGPDQATPDLAAIIQEIVNQDGWVSGNALVLVISDDPANPSSGIRCAEAGSGDDSATLHVEFSAAASFAPTPVDGAVEVDAAALEWTAGGTAVSHKVYVSTDTTIDESDLVGETQLAIQVAILDPGTTYYWRVDDIDADGVVTEGTVWSFATMPLEAHFPNPADGTTDLEPAAQLSWTPGKVVIMHDVYFGTDEAAIAARDMSTFKGKLMTASYDAGKLDLFTTYYWAVDQFTPTGTVAGPVWSFSTAEYILVQDGEATLTYDNTAEPFISELSWDVTGDLTVAGLADITLRFKGGPSNVSFDEATGTYEVAGAGADVWGSADQFHYVYRELTGDATIIAHVADYGSGSNAWAKGGVMIRQSLEVGSVHGMMAITGGNGGGGAFQWRPVADEGSSSAHSDAAGMAPGYWVKLERVGNAFTGSFSADGVTWTQQGDAQTIEMADPVLIGLFVTSHAAGEARTYTFDNVSIDGTISADDISADVDSVSGNSAEPIYVALEDAAGNVGVVAYPDPAATRITQWWNMKISMADFAAQGVDLTAGSKLYFGVGNGEAAGAGAVTVADIQIVKPTDAGDTDDVTAPGDNVLGVPNDGDWPGGEHPALAIDDDTSTKFLHFKGETEASGIQIEPLVGATVVTGLALTTANDAVERDPASFELYGSNESINGPYELIASGDVVDFIQEAAWPRFTKNETPIEFDNTVAYRFYQVMFPTVRDAGSANSMQIAEIELLSAPSPSIVWVSGFYDDDADGAPDDQAWIALLEAEGYKVDYTPGNIWTELDDAKIATLNAADLVIVSRNSNSGDFDDGDEPTQWNSVTTPLILSSTHIIRSSRWKWLDTTSLSNLAPAGMDILAVDHPALAGVASPVAGIDGAVGPSTLPNVVEAGNGTVLAKVADADVSWIISWDTGVEFYDGAGQFAGGPRVFFGAGTQEGTSASGAAIGRGDMNLTDAGQAIFLNMVSLLASGN